MAELSYNLPLMIKLFSPTPLLLLQQPIEGFHTNRVQRLQSLRLASRTAAPLSGTA